MVSGLQAKAHLVFSCSMCALGVNGGLKYRAYFKVTVKTRQQLRFGCNFKVFCFTFEFKHNGMSPVIMKLLQLKIHITFGATKKSCLVYLHY